MMGKRLGSVVGRVVENEMFAIKMDSCFKILIREYVYWFSDWEERRERERNQWERENIDQLPPICAPTRDETCNLVMCPNWRFNIRPLGVRDDAPTNWATQPGLQRVLKHTLHLCDTFCRCTTCLSKVLMAQLFHTGTDSTQVSPPSASLLSCRAPVAVLQKHRFVLKSEQSNLTCQHQACNNEVSSPLQERVYRRSFCCLLGDLPPGWLQGYAWYEPWFREILSPTPTRLFCSLS